MDNWRNVGTWPQGSLTNRVLPFDTLFEPNKAGGWAMRRRAGRVWSRSGCCRRPALMALLVCALLALLSSRAAAEPPLRFIPANYALNLLMYMYSEDNCHATGTVWTIDNPPSWSEGSFARVRVQRAGAANSPVHFKVEGQPDKATYLNRDKKAVDICAEKSSGLLRLTAPLDEKTYQYVNDFPTQRVELSATDAALKVYRDVLVEPPARLPDCSDYPDQDIDRYTCLFLGETLPPTAPPTTTAALRAALPHKTVEVGGSDVDKSLLVQPRANYELVFAEEFNGTTGTYPSSNCAGGLSNVDADKWVFANYWCKNVDANDEPCATMENGAYSMAWTTECSPALDTMGKFRFKYGYVETKWTVNLHANAYEHYYYMVMGHPDKPMRSVNKKYGTHVRGSDPVVTPWSNYEGLGRFVETEIDIFEFYPVYDGNPKRQRDIFFRFINYWPFVQHEDARPIATNQFVRYCDYKETTTLFLDFLTQAQCAARGELTVTRGLEWTPRGYRTFVKVDGAHTDFIVVPKKDTTIRLGKRKRIYGNGRVSYHDSFVTYREGSSTHARYFEFLDTSDQDSVLEQAAIAHMPLEIILGAWKGKDAALTRGDTILTKMKIDYVRVFQPTNRYADMEPFYQ